MKEYVNRILNLEEKLKHNSIFLIGPLRVGKSSLIEHQLKEDVKFSWSLTDDRTRRKSISNPWSLRDEIEKLGIKEGIVVIDEIQKVPKLLEVVKAISHESNIRFLLPVSNAVNLRKKHRNPLDGCFEEVMIHPFVWPEIKERNPDLKNILEYGLIPSVYFSIYPEIELSDYIDLYYLKEIIIEGKLKRNREFQMFLHREVLYCTDIINCKKTARALNISSVSINKWYNFLSDTLMGFYVHPYTKTRKRKGMKAERFYFFDVGIVRFFYRMIRESINYDPIRGRLFRSYIAQEIRAYLNYTESHNELCHWMTNTHQYSVDFLIGDDTAIQLTGFTPFDSSIDLKGLRALKEEGIFKTFIFITMEDHSRISDDGILILNWKDFLNKLWSGSIVSVDEMPN